jgi:GNAT superfamily N-acetyltransferase
MSALRLHTFADRPGRGREADALCGPAWPEFMRHDPVSDQWPRLMSDFPGFQVFLCDGQDAIVAVGNAIPVAWDGRTESLPDRGWDAAFESGIAGRRRGTRANALAALQAVVVAGRQGQGLGSAIVAALREVARRDGLGFLIAPVRPSMKHLYPLMKMEDYAAWTRGDNLPFDPWLRVHRRLGAVSACIAPRSMRIPGTLSQWRSWTGMEFPVSGRYVVPGALNPVTVNIEMDRALYVEPNVWMVHRVR